MDESHPFVQAVRAVLEDRLLYLGQYICTVQSQDDDGRLDLLPDDERVRGTGLTKVPIRYGIPGVKARVRAGARVTLGFEAGDPGRPYAGVWDPGEIESLSFHDGTARLARMGDPVTIFWPATAAVDGAIPAGALVGQLSITSVSVGIIRDGVERVTA